MKKILYILIILAALIQSCSDDGVKETTAKSEYFISVDSCKISQNDKEFFNTDVFHLLCRTNLPVGTQLILSKGIRLNTVVIDTLENTVIHDTLKISDEKFEISFPVKYATAGYISFKAIPKENTSARTFYWEYSIEYKRQMTENEVSIPEFPIKIIVSNIKMNSNERDNDDKK